MELERLSHGGRTKNVQDRVPNQGRAEGLPSGGLPRKGWDKDGDDDAFLQPACPGHREHLGCGRFPSSKMITMFQTCRLQKCILIVILVPALPGQSSTGKPLGPSLVGKSIRYVLGLPPVAEAVQLHCSSFAFPCCVIRWDASDPAAISFLHSPHSTHSFFRSRYVSPSPVIFLPCAASDWLPAAGHGLHTMLTVLPTLVCIPTRSNKPTRALNAHCSQRISDDATMPSSA